jgi:hypothetical protein
MKKLPMILSASESSDRILRAHHWDAAIRLLDEVEDTIPDMIRAGQAMDTTSQTGLVAAVLQELKNSSKIHSATTLAAKLASQGFRGEDVMKTIHYLTNGSDLVKQMSSGLVLIDDPNLYL